MERYCGEEHHGLLHHLGRSSFTIASGHGNLYPTDEASFALFHSFDVGFLSTFLVIAQTSPVIWYRSKNLSGNTNGTTGGPGTAMNIHRKQAE
jgi:hypothetical protein